MKEKWEELSSIGNCKIKLTECSALKKIIIFITGFKFLIPNCFYGKLEEMRYVYTTFLLFSAVK